MDKDRLQDLKNKVVDYKRFAFILLSLSAFLSIGMLLPTGALADKDYLKMIIFILLSVGLSIYLHQSAMTIEEKILEEES